MLLELLPKVRCLALLPHSLSSSFPFFFFFFFFFFFLNDGVLLYCLVRPETQRDLPACAS